jgi:2-hydroxychromene-2-carboxylate isomerase
MQGARGRQHKGFRHIEDRKMGELINLAERRKQRRRSRTGPRSRAVRAEFLYDLACPFTYLAAERVERSFDDVVWTPASATALRRGSPATDEAALAGVQAAAEERAAAVRLPLVWPETWPADVPAAMRVASYAAEHGRGAAFALAAGRLAFCGGFDVDDPDILAEAAAAAGLGLEESLRAAGDNRRDGAIEAAARRLLAVGADRLPALRVGRSLFWGDSQVADAVATARLSAAACR